LLLCIPPVLFLTHFQNIYIPRNIRDGKTLIYLTQAVIMTYTLIENSGNIGVDKKKYRGYDIAMSP